MFKIPFLRNIFLVFLVITILMPLIHIKYIYPSFIEALVEATENEAIRAANPRLVLP